MRESRLTAEMASTVSVIRELAEDADSLETLQKAIVKAISQRLPGYDWTGFYMLDTENTAVLMLGPFLGEPTPHVRIPVDQGICGAAVLSEKTIVVDDVNADSRYLSCSTKTRSEIVVPIFCPPEKSWAKIHVDSHTPSIFTDGDRLFLEEIAGIVGIFMENLQAGPLAPVSSCETPAESQRC